MTSFEAAARASWDAARSKYTPEWDELTGWAPGSFMCAHTVEHHRTFLRAVLTALREPSEAMMLAADRETTPGGCWSSMIDVLIKDAP